MRSPKDTYGHYPINYTDQESAAGQQSGQWRREGNVNKRLVSICTNGLNNHYKSSKNVRDDFEDYFNSQEGSVSWQLDMVTCTSNAFNERLFVI